jgi:hypothetical protein
VGFPAQGLPPSAAPQLTRELTFDLRVGQGEAAQGAGEEEGAGGQAGRGEGTGAEETEGRTAEEGRAPAAAHGEAEDLVRGPAAIRIRGRMGAVLSDTDPFEFECLGCTSEELKPNGPFLTNVIREFPVPHLLERRTGSNNSKI